MTTNILVPQLLYFFKILIFLIFVFCFLENEQYQRRLNEENH
jgi:hypothetical protein